MTKEEILGYLSSRKPEFRQIYGVEKIGLFGSYARDEANEQSDIDIFVRMEPDLFNLSAMKQHIENDLHITVDIVREHSRMKPLLMERIRKDIIYV